MLEHYKERGATVSSIHYSVILRDQLKPTIRKKRRRLQLEGVAILHNNGRHAHRPSPYNAP
jgi:hypothetical protein